jgi:hypothetical protein
VTRGRSAAQAEEEFYRIPPSQRTAIGSEAGSSGAGVKKEEEEEESKMSVEVKMENESGASTDGVQIKTEKQDE